MSFVSAFVVSFAPVLVAILIAALTLPRAWLASYAAFLLVAIVVYADLNRRYDDVVFGGMFSALLGMLTVTALAAGLVTRWALKSRASPPD